MHYPTLRQLYFMTTIMLLVLVGCQTDDGGSSDANNSGGGSGSPQQVESMSTGSGAILAWVGEGVAPGEHDPDNPGQIALIDDDGEAETVLELPAGTIRVYPCGDGATSPDNRYFSFLVGSGDTGTLYQMRDTDEPQAIGDDTHAITCIGMGSFGYSPDSDQVGYIDYGAGVLQNDTYGSGQLRIFEADSLEQQVEFDNVNSFAFGDDFVTFISFFPNADDEVTEAAVSRWTSGNPDEVATLRPGEGCTFRTGSVTPLNDTTLLVLMGSVCPTGTWSLFSVDTAERSTTLILEASTGLSGGYFVEHRANAVFAAPDESGVFLTHPEGTARNFVDVLSTPLDSVEISEPLVEVGVMPRFNALNIYDPNVNAAATVSPDGRWLAIVSDTNSVPAQVNVLDLNAPGLAPITYRATNQSDTVSGMAFTRDSSQLVFIAGDSDRESNSLFTLDLQNATENRIIRGRFAPGVVVSPTGNFIALTDWQPEYMNMVLVDIPNNQTTTLLEGAEIVDDEVVNQQFYYLLSWRG